MKRLIAAAAAALGLTGCVAVPAYGPDAYYYPGPTVGVGVYAAPAYRPYWRHRHHHHRHGHRHH